MSESMPSALKYISSSAGTRLTRLWRARSTLKILNNVEKRIVGQSVNFCDKEVYLIRRHSDKCVGHKRIEYAVPLIRSAIDLVAKAEAFAVSGCGPTRVGFDESQEPWNVRKIGVLGQLAYPNGSCLRM